MWRVFHLKYTTFLGAASLEPVATPFHTPGINLHSMPTNTYPLSRCPAPKIFSQAYAHCMHAVCHHAVDPAFPFILHPCFCSFISCVFGRQWYHTPSHSPMSYRRITHLCNSAAASLSEPPPHSAVPEYSGEAHQFSACFFSRHTPASSFPWGTL